MSSISLYKPAIILLNLYYFIINVKRLQIIVSTNNLIEC